MAVYECGFYKMEQETKIKTDDYESAQEDDQTEINILKHVTGFVRDTTIYYVCDCGKTLKLSQFNLHKRDVNPKPCRICCTVFYGVCEMTKHKRVCGSICPTCNRKFRSPATVERHLSRKRGCGRTNS